MSVYYLVTDTSNQHLIAPSDVVAWVRGYLAHMEVSSPLLMDVIHDLNSQIDDLMERPNESREQTCYRVLRACHDRHILAYRGIVEQE